VCGGKSEVEVVKKVQQKNFAMCKYFCNFAAFF
jgi:hypothetical protein